LTIPPNIRHITPISQGKGGLCMKGNIYEREGRYVVRFKGVYRRCKNKDEAERILTGLRYKEDEGTFDVRDYQKDNPLGFGNLAGKWLNIRKKEVRCFRNLQGHMDKAIAYFGNINIKHIQYGEIEDFLLILESSLSGKTKKNVLATLHTFFVWASKRQYIPAVPEFPSVDYQLGWRNTIGKETQAAIIEEVQRISYGVNPRIWIGIKWLSTYISIRPIEMLNIKEGDIDFSLGVVVVRHTKEGKEKTVPLLDEDIELIRTLPKGFPNLYFFRHDRKRKGVHRNKAHRFGPTYFYKWWKRACDNLGIKDIDLYGGTRHSTVRALRDRFSPEQIKRATMHSTNVAFERYFQIEMDEAKGVYAAAQLPPKVFERNGIGKVLKLKE